MLWLPTRVQGLISKDTTSSLTSLLPEEANYVVLENTGELTVVAKTSAKNTTVITGGS